MNLELNWNEFGKDLELMDSHLIKKSLYSQVSLSNLNLYLFLAIFEDFLLVEI